MIEKKGTPIRVECNCSLFVNEVKINIVLKWGSLRYVELIEEPIQVLHHSKIGEITPVYDSFEYIFYIAYMYFKM